MRLIVCLCVRAFDCVFVRLWVHIVGRVRVCAFGGTHCWECVFVRLGVHIVGTVRVCALDENVRLS